jgi:outer membrane protein assembly factor BamE (lipoprotein component of BamABCDE complex)
MKILKTLLLICCAATFFGCAHTSGTRIDQSALSKIQKGVTTKDSLTAMFGPPNSSSYQADGQEIIQWIYMSSQIKGSSYIPVVGIFDNGVKGSSSILLVKLNKDKIVEDFSLSENSHDVGLVGALGGQMSK